MSEAKRSQAMVVTLLLLGAASCSTNGDSYQRTCEPNTKRDCECSGAIVGVSTCDAMGKSWSPCDCRTVTDGGGPPGDGSPRDGAVPDSAPPRIEKSCQERCDKAEDCQVAYTCTDHRCVLGELPDGCSESKCTIEHSGWTETCTAPGGCPGQVCVKAGGVGYCATEPSATVSCASLGLTEEQLPLIDGSSTVTVCANTEYSCHDNACWKPCTAASCSGAYPFCGGDGVCRCEAASCDGQEVGSLCGGEGCGCAEDAHCPAAARSKCWMGRCGCRIDSDCTEANGDSCYGGSCGCADVTSCTAATTHPRTSWVCEEPR